MLNFGRDCSVLSRGGIRLARIGFLAALTTLHALFLASLCQAQEKAADCELAKDGSYRCTKLGAHTWKRPRDVEWVLVRGVGGGGGGATGGYGGNGNSGTCNSGGGGGEGSPIITQVFGPLDKDEYEFYVGSGGDGGATSNSKHSPIRNPGAKGEDSRFGLFLFPGGKGGGSDTTAQGDPIFGKGGSGSGGAKGGDSAGEKAGVEGSASWAPGGKGGTARIGEEKGNQKSFYPGGGGGGGGGSLGAGGAGGNSVGFKIDGTNGENGKFGGGGGGGGAVCWTEGNRAGAGGKGGSGEILIVPIPKFLVIR